MIISHRYKFIFLKTEKTASSSLLDAFYRVVGGQRSLFPADRSVRRKLLRERGNLEGCSFFGGRRGKRSWFPAFTGLHTHARAADVLSFIGPELFGRYTIITSERNPYDRQVSLFNHRRGSKGAIDAELFSRAICSPTYNLLHYNRLRNWDVYTVGGKVCADHVIRFERLHEDYAAVLESLGIDPGLYPLGHSRDGQRADGNQYRQFYSDAARQVVGSWYRREIEYFGYEF